MYIDLHCHYVPGIDDGVRSVDDGLALCRGLRRAGFERVVATPHIRTAMFPNEAEGVRAAFAAFAAHAEATNDAELPALAHGAEHFCDDVFARAFGDGRVCAYPGGHAILIELPTETMPASLRDLVFAMRLAGVTPVLAHPERYTHVWRSSAELEALVEAGVLPLLDVMSLTERYGREPRRAAERLLDDGLYYAACSDAHKPSDVEPVIDSIARLRRIVGREETDELLGDHPRRVLDGTFGDWL